MDAVPELKRAIENPWFCGKGQSILVEKIDKNPKLGEIKNKIVRNGKVAKKLVKNLSKIAGRKKRGLLRVQKSQPLGRLGRIQEAHVRKT